jgi:steroid 5-alpha reductase family enzyme
MIESWLMAGGAIFLAATLLWAVSVFLKNSSIIDIFWGPMFVLTAWIVFFTSPAGFPTRQWLVAGMVTLWGLRLGGYVFWRNHGRGEDFRYAAWRKQHGSSWTWRSYFQVFILQGILAWIIGWPLVAAISSSTPAQISILDGLGVIVWAFGFMFEAGGDYQLAQFRANPANKGKILDQGFWRYTRHPNYFGDAAQWWGWYLVALGGGGWWTIFGPVMMTILLVRISGVALLEKTLAVEKPGYREYIEKTSAFIPWLPKK